jgi:Ca-activated chloride channel family protein
MYSDEGFGEETQGNRHFNLMLLVGTLIGTLVGAVVGEVLVALLGERVHPVPLVGLYFAQLTFFIFLAVLLCEKIDPRLNSRIWTADHWRDSLKRLPLMSIAAFFALGCVLQFFYGLTAATAALQKADDYIICIDNSGSMSASDAPKDRFKAVLAFVNELDETNNVAVILFSDTADTIIPLKAVDGALRATVSATLNELEPNGGTDIQAALEAAAQIPIAADRTAMVILLSDGESAVDVGAVTTLYNNGNLVLNTIDCSGRQLWRSRLLLSLSTGTGGMNYQIPEMNQLTGTFTKILSGARLTRNLLDYRYGFDRGSALFMILRIFFLALLGAAMSAALAVTLYNADVMKKLLLFQIGTGLLGGAVLELCLYNFWPAPVARLLAALLLGLLVSFFRSAISRRAIGSSGPDRNSNRELARSGHSQW